MFLLLWYCTLDLKVVSIIGYVKTPQTPLKTGKNKQFSFAYLHLTYYEYYFIFPFFFLGGGVTDVLFFYLTEIISFTLIILILSENKGPCLSYT